MSALIISFLDDNSFDPEHVQAMGQAFEGASKSLHAKSKNEAVRKIIAKRVIAIGKTGERDPVKICERVLIAFGIDARTARTLARSVKWERRDAFPGNAPPPGPPPARDRGER